MSSRSEKTQKSVPPPRSSGGRRRRASGPGAVAGTSSTGREAPPDAAGPGSAGTGRSHDAGPIEVSFVYAGGGQAQAVQVAGDFNGWDAGAQPLKPLGGGSFEARVWLPAGEYEYKFVVDGRWVEDPAAERHTPNGFGTRNSVVQVRPASGPAAPG